MKIEMWKNKPDLAIPRDLLKAVDCPKCKGSGFRIGSYGTHCPICKGCGKVFIIPATEPKGK